MVGWGRGRGEVVIFWTILNVDAQFLGNMVFLLKSFWKVTLRGPVKHPASPLTYPLEPWGQSLCQFFYSWIVLLDFILILFNLLTMSLWNVTFINFLVHRSLKSVSSKRFQLFPKVREKSFFIWQNLSTFTFSVDFCLSNTTAIEKLISS